jgi:hypothetical protein
MLRLTQFISLNSTIPRLSPKLSQTTIFHSKMSTVTCNPRRAAELAESLHEVQSRLIAARETLDNPQNTPTLVAVSKLKPLTDIMGCYAAGQRDFGENYVNELTEKSHMVCISSKELPNVV